MKIKKFWNNRSKGFYITFWSFLIALGFLVIAGAVSVLNDEGLTTPAVTTLGNASFGSNLLYNANKNHLITTGTTPTLSSCGTSPTINGSDIAGKVIIGSIEAEQCLVIFSQPYVVAPSCVISVETNAGTNPYTSTTSTTQLNVQSNSDGTGDIFTYICLGIL